MSLSEIERELGHTDLDDIAQRCPEAFVAWERGPHRLVAEATKIVFRWRTCWDSDHRLTCLIRRPGAPIHIGRSGQIARPADEILSWDPLVGAWIYSRKFSAIVWAYTPLSPLEHAREKWLRDIRVLVNRAGHIEEIFDFLSAIARVEQDLLYLNTGVLSPDEIRASRWGRRP